MWEIVKCDLRRLFKNPLYYIGFLLIVINVWGCCKPYLNIHYFDNEYKPALLKPEQRVDLDINKGYIPPLNEREQLELGLEQFKIQMINDNVMTSDEVDSIIDKILSENMTIKESLNYLNKGGKIHISEDMFAERNCLKSGTYKELNTYIEEKLSMENYTSFFSKKFVDYLGVHLSILMCVLLVFMIKDDFSKDTYELLHTRSVSSSKYIISKVISGCFSIVFFVIVISFIFDCIVTRYGIRQGFPVNFGDMWIYILLCIIPLIVFSVSFNIFITCIFKRPIAAIPMMILLLYYANLGVVVSGEYTYQHRLFQILPRFPGLFFESSINNTLLINQVLLIVLSVAMVWGACKIWDKRRII